MMYPWSANRSNSGSSSDPETGGTPLDDLPRQSTETQRRNDFRQSTLPDRGGRIMEDISNENYTCSICVEPIIQGSTYEYSMWHCLNCYNVNHFRCAKSWADASNRSVMLSAFLVQGRWKCPNCAVECAAPKARCWCQKQPFGVLGSLSNAKPNACLDTCDRAGTCPHSEKKPCLKLCHPGPCNVPCSPSCTNLPVILPTPTRWNHFCERVQLRRQGTFRVILSLLMLLIFIYGLLGIWLYFHIMWWTKPFKYPGFSESARLGEFMSCLMLGIFVVMPAVITILTQLFKIMTDFLVGVLNLDSQRTGCDRKIVIQFFGGLLLLLIFAGVGILPILGFAGGTDIAWYNQMKNSCNGFNARVAMHNTGKFEVESLSSNIPAYEMYLASWLEPVEVPGDRRDTRIPHPFEYYQRLSISRPDFTIPNKELKHIAIDVDIPHTLYRIVGLNRSDTMNEYRAYNFKNSLTDLPTFHPMDETLISNGTFTAISATEKHMLVPELNIGIANMYQFVNDYYQEPFIKVYENLSPYWRMDAPGENPTPLLAETERFRTTLNEPWDSKKIISPDHEVIMRTASFGHGRQRLDMCVKEDEVEMDGKWVSEGVHEEVWVPFAIMAAYKQRNYEMSDYTNSGPRSLL